MNAAHIVSLGCRMNIAESEQMRALLAGETGLVVVNSCAVTGEALRQTRQAIRRARRDHPDARLVVTGCAAEIDRAKRIVEAAKTAKGAFTVDGKMVDKPIIEQAERILRLTGA